VRETLKDKLQDLPAVTAAYVFYAEPGQPFHRSSK